MASQVPISASLHTHTSFVSMFNGHNYTEWCEQIQFHLGVLELDLALHVDKPAAITDTSSEGEISVHTAWERSNRLSLMLMRMTIASNIKSTLPPTEKAKDFIKLVGERSQTADKSLAGTLMATLTTIKFDGSRSMYEHVMEMTNIAARLKSLEMNVDDNFLVQFVLNSLPPEYGPFQMNYNTMKDKWNVNELHSMLVQEETRLKNQGTHSVHLITNQGAGKKVGRKNKKGKQGPLKVNESSVQIHKKDLSHLKCRFCVKPGHFQKDCSKRKAWFERKGIQYDPAHKRN
ncbi:hypothetical protein CASFOL_005396 [Castilleja foliolosa]|uniref:CCHC-type domain-containing protein n=1 Tax=Castilleja foliolosa TaxID=1961234 RepID=A0ABD3E3M6_9LAMI